MKIPNCIRCDKPLQSVSETTPGAPEFNQPMGGLSFMTHGHFGSEMFDPMDANLWLEINVCDPCVEELRDAGKILHVAKLAVSFTTPIIMETWNKYKHG